MKITCQSCQAKYTIADEKVVGKTVKIKCKKCGAAIVVNASDAAAEAPGHGPYEDDDDGATRVFSGDAGAPAGENEWTVNVGDDDQRTMTTAAIAAAYASGTVTGDTYVWKDGMSDWLPLSQVPELAAAVSGGGGAVAAAAGGDLGGTVVMNEGAGAAPAAARGGASAARKGGGGGAGRDLFGTNKPDADPGAAAARAAASNEPKAVGERNENSVLFSLSALTATEKAATKDEPKKKDGRGGLDDIMNLGGGSLGGPMLAPPPLMAPVVEPPPMQQPMMGMPGMTATQIPLTGTQIPLTGTQVPQVVMVQVPEQKKSSAGIIIGVVLGLAVAGAAAFFFLKPPANNTTTTENTTPSATATTTTTAPTTAPTESVAAQTPSSTPSTAPTAADTKAGSTGGGPGPVVGTGPKPTGTGAPTSAPSTTPTTAPTPSAEPTATGGGGDKEFNRGAASSALGAAAGAAKSCKTPDGPTGTGKVKVTFAPSGNVTSAQVQGPPFAGTSVGGCVAGVFRGARVPPFDGSPVSVTKSFTIN